MKKHLFIMVAVLLSLVSCNKGTGAAGPESDTLPATFHIDLAGLSATKAAYSDGTKATQLYVGLYDVTEGSPVYLTKLSAGPDTGNQAPLTLSGLQATYSTNLVKGQQYKLVFWAQVSGNAHYSVNMGSHQVSVATAGIANDESRDAFWGSISTGVVTGTIETGVTLKRPFAQINVLTTEEDWDNAIAAGVSFSKSEMCVPGCYSVLDLLDGSVSSPATYTFSASAIQVDDAYAENGYSASDTYKYVAMNYVLVDAASSVRDVTFGVYKSTDGSAPMNTYTVSNVPAQRNYRTNLVGDIFTASATFNIQVALGYAGSLDLGL